MRYILVGPDGSGKTTFAKEFAKLLNLEYVNCTFREENKYEATLKLLQRDNIIYDRLYMPDHLIYSYVKDIDMSSDEYHRWVDLIDIIKNLNNIIIIYLDADDHVIKHRLGIRGDEYIEFEDIKNIRSAYDRFLPLMEIPIVKMRSLMDGSIIIEGVDYNEND